MFTWKTHCSLKFHFGQIDHSEICTKVSFISPEVMWTLIMKLPYTELKFYNEAKSQTSLSSLWVSCKRALSRIVISTHGCLLQVFIKFRKMKVTHLNNKKMYSLFFSRNIVYENILVQIC